MHSMTRIALLAGSLILLQGCSDSDDDPVAPVAPVVPVAVADDAVAADGSPLQTVPDDGVGGAAGDVGDDATDVTGTGGVGGTPDVADADDDPGTGTTPTAAPTTGSGGFAAIAGLYDASTEEEGAIDEIYVEILADGTFTLYDYDGDDFDQGENCYFIATGQLASLGGDSYRLTGEEFGEVEAMLVRSGDSLVLTFTDTFDDDGDGDTTETFGESWTLVTNLSSTDFNEC